MQRVVVSFALLAVGCSDSPEPIDPCSVAATSGGGAVEVSLGDPFVPVTDGQEAQVQLGAQGLWMFVASARVTDLDVGDAELQAAVEFSVLANGAIVSLDLGCRGREFGTVDGQFEMRTPFIVPLDPSFSPMLEGASVTLVASVRDHDGRNAVVERSLVSRFPP